MEKLMAFIEDYSLERKFYTRIDDIYRSQKWEIYYKHNSENSSNPHTWNVKKIEDKNWLTLNKGEMIRFIYKNNIDIINFEMELQTSIKNLIVFTHLLQKQAKKLLGKDIVEKTNSEYEDFAKNLINSIKKFLPSNEKKDVLKKGVADKKTQTVRKPNLRIVKG